MNEAKNIIKTNIKRSARFSVAPMMGWTDRHCRALMRLFSRHTRLYTEMITADAVLHGDRERLLARGPSESPVALQLGGAEAGKLAEAARIGAGFGYDEINLNIGCPSERVQSGRFGACLMAEPELVAACVSEMKQAVDIPVTVKCRIGIDEHDPEHTLLQFAAHMAGAGADVLIVHARKAWLKGLSPKQNRDVPPLDHALVHRLKASMPDLKIVINGGISTLADTHDHLAHVDGVMVGRAAYHAPELLAGVDYALFGEPEPASDTDMIVGRYLSHIEAECARGTPLISMTRHMSGLFHGSPGARAWRRYLAQNAHQTGAGPAIVAEALNIIETARAEAASRRAA